MILINKKTKKLAAILVVLITTACSASDQPINPTEKASEEAPDVALQVYKSPTCGCCKKWMTHLDNNGFKTVGHDRQNLNILKDEKGVPANYRSCHTGISDDGYVFEGHIPAKFISKFLQEKPAGAIGLTVPGMPVGSPGMEYQNKFNPYEILKIMKDGSVASYATVNTLEDQF
ncbi:MAG: DUF411 domain-containing protein [Proteobacteria bacterium]|nr:DUF411 domain-containing protein [Pseudomonadota bacterium]